MRALLLAGFLVGCCTVSSGATSQVSTALQAPDSHAALNGLFAELGQQLVCALERVAAGSLTQGAAMETPRQRAIEWLTSHGYKVPK